MGSAGPESTKVRRLRLTITVGWQPTGRVPGKIWKAQGLRAPRGEDLRPMMAVGWQPTGRVAGTNGTCRA